MSDVGKWLVSAIPSPYQPLIVIAGQSNALGAAVDAKTRVPVPWSVYADTDASTWPATLDLVGWTLLKNRAGNHHGCEFGLASSAIAAGYSPTIVKTAVNGSGLAAGAGATWGKAAAEIYPAALAWIQSAQNYAGRKVDALIWNQGEADANDESKSLAYQANLTQIVSDLRADLVAPGLHVLVVRMRADSGVAYPENVRAAQTAFVSADGAASIINVDDLTLQDTVHLDSASQTTLGERCWSVIAGLSL